MAMAVKVLICTLVFIILAVDARGARHGSIGVVSDLEYNIFVKKLSKKYDVNYTARTTNEKSAVVRFYRNREHLSLRGDPPKLFFRGKEVLTNSRLAKLVKKKFHEMKGVGIKTIFFKLQERYAGISRQAVRRVLQAFPGYIQKQIKFTNSAPLKHVTSRGVHNHLQIDIIDMNKVKIVHGDTIYNYILSVMDIFSRYVWLRPLAGKASATVKEEFEDIIEEYGCPKFIQHDQGKEFSGAFKVLMQKKNIKVIRSRPYHPQSQGRIERMHRSLKTKIMYDLKHCGRSGVSWVKQLPKYRRSLNQTPKECLGWKSPHDIYFGRGPEGADRVRKKAAKASKLDDNRNDRRHNKSLKSPVFRIGTTVYVRVKKPGKVSKYSVVNGKVIDRKIKNAMYLIRYRLCKKLTSKWHHVSDISHAADLKLNHKFKYYIVKNKHDYTEELRSEFGLEVLFNPPGDGDCQFAAVANQLHLVGVHRSAKTLREEIVQFLSTHSYFGNQRNPWWNYITDSRESYLSEMSRRGVYGDHITLQAMSEYFNIQILVVSTVNEHTTLITPSGEQIFNDDVPVIVIGHYPENCGEHYVSLQFDKQTFRRILNSTDSANNDGRRFRDDRR